MNTVEGSIPFPQVDLPPVGPDETDEKCTPVSPANRPVVVLMADDDDDDRMLAVDAFREARLANQVQCVTDGEELMDYLHRRGKFAPPAIAPRPGLILLDLNMPRKDGREALREIKAHPDLRSIAVVVLTTSESGDDIKRVYDLGASSYISKPVTFEGLVKAMKVVGEYWFRIVRMPDNADD